MLQLTIHKYNMTIPNFVCRQMKEAMSTPIPSPTIIPTYVETTAQVMDISALQIGVCLMRPSCCCLDIDPW